MKIYKIFLFALIFSLSSFSQQDTVKNINPDSVVAAKTDTLLKKTNSLLTKEETKKDTAKTGKDGMDFKPPAILEVISFGKIIWALILLLMGFWVIKIITKLFDIWAERSAAYRITLKGVVPIIRIFGWIIILYILIAGIFKPPVATIIAVTASVGIAVGFAAQDFIKNIFGGIMILFDRPFQVGDKIEIQDYYGEVIKIGLRSTRIVTPDDSMVTIPNGELMNKPVSNSNSGEPNCQVVAEIYLPVNIDTSKVREIAIEAAQVSKYIYLNKPITVLFFNEVKQRKSYLKMRLKAYVMDIRYEFNFKSDMTEIVLRELFNQKMIKYEDLI